MCGNKTPTSVRTGAVTHPKLERLSRLLATNKNKNLPTVEGLWSIFVNVWRGFTIFVAHWFENSFGARSHNWSFKLARALLLLLGRKM